MTKKGIKTRVFHVKYTSLQGFNMACLHEGMQRRSELIILYSGHILFVGLIVKLKICVVRVDLVDDWDYEHGEQMVESGDQWIFILLQWGLFLWFQQWFVVPLDFNMSDARHVLAM